jgi:hypothetical protein
VKTVSLSGNNMSARSILILSLGLNLILAAWVVGKARRTAASSSAHLTQAESAASAAKSLSVWRVKRTNVIEVTTNRVDAPGFHWSQIETNDYDVFVANLRGVGCPEKTIRNLILADVEELYAGRLADAEEPELFWATESQRVAQNSRERRVAEKQAALAAEKRALLMRLVSASWSAKALHEWVSQKEAAFILGFLPDESALRLMETVMQLEQRTRAFQSETKRIVIDTDEPRLNALIAEARREMTSCVTPAEVEELLLRAYDLGTGFADDERLVGVTISGVELRQMAAIGSRELDLVDMVVRQELDRPKDHEDMDERLKHLSPAAEAEIHRLLGDQRFAAYMRSKNESFQEYAQAAQQHQLPVDTAIKAYDIRRAAEAAARELKSNRELAPEQRRAALDAMLREAQQAMRSAVGEEAMEDFFRADSDWARNAFGAQGGKKP